MFSEKLKVKSLKAKVFIRLAGFNLPIMKDLCDNIIGQTSVCQMM